MHMMKDLGIQLDWQMNYQICLFHVYCINKLDFYILDVPASNRLIIEQGVSEYLNFLLQLSINTIHKFLNKMFDSLVDSFGSWCIIASSKTNKTTSVIRCTNNRWGSDLQIFNDFRNLQKAQATTQAFDKDGGINMKVEETIQ